MAQHGSRELTTDTTTAHAGCLCCRSGDLSRRRVMAAAGAWSASAMLPSIARAQTPSLVDTHHHFYPPDYQKAWLDWEVAHKLPHFPSRVPGPRANTGGEKDTTGTRTAALSLAATPGVGFGAGGEAASRMVR